MNMLLTLDEAAVISEALNHYRTVISFAATATQATAIERTEAERKLTILDGLLAR